MHFIQYYGIFIISSFVSPCSINIDDSSQWPSKNPPILLDEIGNFIIPDVSGSFQISDGESFMLGCPGTSFNSDSGDLLYGHCSSGDLEVGQETVGSLSDYGCQRQPEYTTQIIESCGPDNKAKLIQIEFDVDPGLDDEGVTITVCHDPGSAAALWSQHILYNEIVTKDTGNNRPSFDPEYFDFDVDFYYKMETQRATVADLVGSQTLADKYIGDQSSQLFLSRGHLAPNADFIFYSWQDSTYWFINVAPQWQSFNGAHWNQLENSCRNFATDRGIDIVVYTGTSGVIELEDVNGNMVPIYLYNGDQLPVPRYYWKILHDTEAGSGVAIVGINNPHLETVSEDMLPCPPLSDHPLLTMSDPTNIVKGYMLACKVEDLAKAVPEVPDLPPMDLLS